ncbi:MAG: hypothetical protein AAGD01_16270 [Acidobacteriota bacterium]
MTSVEAYYQDGKKVPVDGRRLQLVSVFEVTETGTIIISEAITVATAYAFSQFCAIGDGETVLLSDPNRALHLAFAMKNNFYSTAGERSPVIQSPPNGLQTNSLALLNFLANLAYYCEIDQDVYDSFLQLTGTGSLYAALFYLTRNPFTDPQGIYSLISDRGQPYSPSLPQLDLPGDRSPIPDQWTLTVKVNRSGAQNFLPAGIGYIDFDCNDRVWLANNVRQGTPESATFCIVLEPDGSPAPFSPVFGGGLLGAGFGITAGPKRQSMYISNFGWGGTEYNPQHGSVSVFGVEGRVLSPPNGYVNGLNRVQGINLDPSGNLWLCSWGSQDPMPPASSTLNFPSTNSSIVIYLDCDPNQVLSYFFDNPYHQTFDVDFDDQGYAYVSNSGSLKDETKSSVYKFAISEDRKSLEVVKFWISDYVGELDDDASNDSSDGDDEPKVGYETIRQITVAPDGHVYAAGVASNRVIQFDQDLTKLQVFEQAIDGPWGVIFDEAGVMYVSNFAREMDYTDDDPDFPLGPFGVTVVHNGDPSTAQLLTLPTGGEQVTLDNGLPLYGNPQDDNGQTLDIPCYDPLMRLTASRIDRAGNLWACNNWKPSIANNVVYGNPGGDGMVIFVGVAAPRRDQE